MVQFREIHRPGIIAETLRSGDTEKWRHRDEEQYRHGIIRGGAQPQHWRRPGNKQLTHCQLKTCKPGVGETWF